MRKEMTFIGAMGLLILAGAVSLIYSQASTGTVSLGQISAVSDFPPPPDGFRHGPGPGPGPDSLAALDLTEQQKTQIDTIRTTAHDAAKDYEHKIRAADEQIHLMIEGGNFSVEKATPLVKAKTDAMEQAELIRLTADAEVQKLLTSDQKAQLASLRERRPPFPPGEGQRPQRQ